MNGGFVGKRARIKHASKQETHTGGGACAGGAGTYASGWRPSASGCSVLWGGSLHPAQPAASHTVPVSPSRTLCPSERQRQRDRSRGRTVRAWIRDSVRCEHGVGQARPRLPRVVRQCGGGRPRRPGSSRRRYVLWFLFNFPPPPFVASLCHRRVICPRGNKGERWDRAVRIIIRFVSVSSIAWLCLRFCGERALMRCCMNEWMRAGGVKESLCVWEIMWPVCVCVIVRWVAPRCAFLFAPMLINGPLCLYAPEAKSFQSQVRPLVWIKVLYQHIGFWNLSWSHVPNLCRNLLCDRCDFCSISFIYDSVRYKFLDNLILKKLQI
jgi:hypothetical protein